MGGSRKPVTKATKHVCHFRAAVESLRTENDQLAREAIGMKAAWMEVRNDNERLRAALQGMLALYAPSALSGQMAPGNETVASALNLVRHKGP